MLALCPNIIQRNVSNPFIFSLILHQILILPRFLNGYEVKQGTKDAPIDIKERFDEEFNLQTEHMQHLSAHD